MKYPKILYILCSITTVSFTMGYTASPPTHKINAPLGQANTKPSQTLLDALAVIGGSTEDIDAFRTTGIPSNALIKSFINYAQNSNKSIFNNLTQDQNNALVLFGFRLGSNQKIPEGVMDDLMVAEKMRVGMSSSDIKTLQTLISSIQNDSTYELTEANTSFIQTLIPYINNNPFAFADAIGPLISALVIEENVDNPNVSEELETCLTDAAQSLTTLTDDQINNITNITQNYNSTENFEASDDNVSDLNVALAAAALPLGLFALYPLIGSDDVYAVNNITRNYPDNFDRDYVNRYQGEFNRGLDRRDNWNNRRNGEGRGPGNRDQIGQRRENGGPRAQDRGLGPNNGNRQGLDRGGQGGNRGSLNRGNGGRSLDRSRGGGAGNRSPGGGGGRGAGGGGNRGGRGGGGGGRR